jgi:drug/metabolite transporter (DMT)-like permease
MKYVSAFETNLIIGLEPLYGILMAVFIFKEYQHFTAQFYFASFCISGYRNFVSNISAKKRLTW